MLARREETHRRRTSAARIHSPATTARPSSRWRLKRSCSHPIHSASPRIRGLALLVVLDRLAPAERLTFVLHDAFGMPFVEIANILGRSPDVVRQMAGRARRRVRGGPVATSAQEARETVKAFMLAAREGDLPALLRLLDPDVTLRVDPKLLPDGAPTAIHGAETVASRARMGAGSHAARMVLEAGQPAIAVAPNGRQKRVLIFDVKRGRIVSMEAIADAAQLAALPMTLAENE